MLLRKNAIKFDVPIGGFSYSGTIPRNQFIWATNQAHNREIDKLIALEKDDEKISLLIKKKESFELYTKRIATDHYRKLKKKRQKKSAIEKLIKLKIKKQKLKAICIFSRIKKANSYWEMTKAKQAYYNWRSQNPWLFKRMTNTQPFIMQGYSHINQLVNMVDGMRIK